MEDDPDLRTVMGYGSPCYENYLYSGLSGMVMRRSHALLEKKLPTRTAYPKIIEVGGGAGFHVPYVRHEYSTYCLTDSDADSLERARERISDPRLEIRQVDASAPIAVDAGSRFDRLIASHVLEHIPEPHKALREWDRLVAPGGVMSIALPCDPGLVWRLGQRYNVFRKRRSEKNALMYAMAREHINPIGALVNLIRYYFDRRREIWWPTRIPSLDANLLYIVQIQKSYADQV